MLATQSQSAKAPGGHGPAQRTAVDISREVLGEMARRGIVPTPDNYRMAFERVAGVPSHDPFPFHTMLGVVGALPKETMPQIMFSRYLDEAVRESTWAAFQKAMVSAAASLLGKGEASSMGEIVTVLEKGIVPFIAGDVALQEHIKNLSDDILTGRVAQADLRGRLEVTFNGVQRFVEYQREVTDAQARVFRLLVDNISALVIDDCWIRGQVELVRERATDPLDLRSLEDVEQRLLGVISTQTALKAQLHAARDRIQDMLSGFVGQLSSFGEGAGAYHRRLTQCAGQVSAASSLLEVSEVIGTILGETESMCNQVAASERAVGEMQSQVARADAEILRLRGELAVTSKMVRHDQLTGVLNRTGLEETFEREWARARRSGSPLCVALLDIDDFSSINNNHGHATGDAALIHLAEVVRNTLRPQDILARVGGEEFVILLADVHAEGAQAAMERLQRGLTKQFFMHQKEKLLITFSAGVTELTLADTLSSAKDRADKAMYMAKHAGKNRVCVG